eukprot:TRINITY_DN11125_c0_g1_i1.p1 TRINITY_DN11125_c0_g1~~TRINITY_DN11125_c0_g1_i1.p1  ORF type:complete len:469 (-),score=145.22 TRINITY_DN11125_c0_g1_i1:1114-2427(-)
MGIPTAGGITVTVSGRNFGAVAGAGGLLQVVVNGGLLCTNVKMITPQLKFTCTIPAGAGFDNTMMVQVGPGNFNSNTAASMWSAPFSTDFLYAPPTITAVSTGTTTNSPMVTITGTNYGTVTTASGWRGARSVSIGGTPCVIKSFTNTVITCQMPSAVGTAMTVSVNINGATTPALPKFTWSYPLPVVTTVVPSNVQANKVFTITGSNFGPATGTVVQVKVGGYLATGAYVSVAHTQIIATAPLGTGSNKAVTVTVTPGSRKRSMVDSSSDEIDFPVPTLTMIVPNVNLPTAGNINVTITGTGFGPSVLAPGSSRTILIGNKHCTNITMLEEDTVLVCMLPAGVGANVPVMVNVDGVVANAGEVSYHAPLIVSIHPFTSIIPGTTRITLTGGFFGPITAARKIRLGDGKCESIQVISDTQISGLVTSGQGANQYLTY